MSASVTRGAGGAGVGAWRVDACCLQVVIMRGSSPRSPLPRAGEGTCKRPVACTARHARSSRIFFWRTLDSAGSLSHSWSERPACDSASAAAAVPAETHRPVSYGSSRFQEGRNEPEPCAGPRPARIGRCWPCQHVPPPRKERKSTVTPGARGAHRGHPYRSITHDPTHTCTTRRPADLHV